MKILQTVIAIFFYMFNLSEKYSDDPDYTFAMSVYQIVRNIPDSRRKQKLQGDVLNMLNDLKFDILEEEESRRQGFSGRQQEFANRGYESMQIDLGHQQQGYHQQGYNIQRTREGQKSTSQHFQVHSGGQRQLQSNEALGHHSQDLPSGNWLVNQDVWGQGPSGITAHHVQTTKNNPSQLQHPGSLNVTGFQAQKPVHTPSFQAMLCQESSNDTISDLLAFARKPDSDTESDARN